MINGYEWSLYLRRKGGNAAKKHTEFVRAKTVVGKKGNAVFLVVGLRKNDMETPIPLFPGSIPRLHQEFEILGFDEDPRLEELMVAEEYFNKVSKKTYLLAEIFIKKNGTVHVRLKSLDLRVTEEPLNVFLNKYERSPA